jgi:nucleoside-triphosphatase
MVRASNLLITGRPGVGKTTVLVNAIRRLEDVRLAGLVTGEIRESGRRVGFSAETLAGERRVMAHVEIESPHRVGRYGVDVAAIDDVVELAFADEPTAEAFVIDEIGKMELFSVRFVTAMERLLADPRPLVASIAQRGPGLIAEARGRPDVELWEVDVANREAMPERIAKWVIRAGRELHSIVGRAEVEE